MYRPDESRWIHSVRKGINITSNNAQVGSGI